MLFALGAIVVLGGAFLWIAGLGVFGEIDSVRIEPAAAPRAVQAPSGRQILFGDLHVHTTISPDAFFMNTPFMGGGGAMTPSDACDFARHCAALDFWSINDHAYAITPNDWRNTVEAIRACNARSADPSNPDTVAFLGWEWTQSGLTPDTHYGHKNVVLASTDDDSIPLRPIAAKPMAFPLEPVPTVLRGAAGLLESRVWDLAARIEASADVVTCPEGHVRDLPGDCLEIAPTPVELFRKLDEWGHDAIVIPHGTAWGIYTPPGSSWSKQLEGAMHDPDRQTMIEVYSGHGDSEVYRDWREVEIAEDGSRSCPPARPDYLPVCQRAGQIIRERCLAAGESDAECGARAKVARQHSVDAVTKGTAVVPQTRKLDWLDAGQCRDCQQPSFSYIPKSSAQYIMALGNFDDDPAAPRRFRMGFMASSDNHSARAGTGYKELRAHTDGGLDDPASASVLVKMFQERLAAPPDPAGELPSRSEPVDPESGGGAVDFERSASFQYTGGLVAVHADGRDRGSVWSALQRNEMYGTSGPRILLWFDLLTDDGPRPMGAEVEADAVPTFRVRAAGSLEQEPGCPDDAAAALGPDLLKRLCVGECYNPSDRRRPITRIDVVRIRPQAHANEDMAALIDDPWKTFACDTNADACEAVFSDPEFPGSGRDAVYYARVFEPPVPTVNANPTGCEYDAEGNCVSVKALELTAENLAPDAPRAWSSPIFVDHPAARRSR